MDESTPIRALTIGVSIFLTLATVGAIMVYYNTARDAASVIGNQATDISGNYRQDIEDMLLSGGTITGTDVINLLNYFKDDNFTKVNISNIQFIKQDDASTCSGDICIMNATRENVNNTPTSFDDTLKKILPNQEFNLEVTDNDDGTKLITLKGE